MSSKRIQWPDLLKAFAITLVVIGHVVSTYDPRGYKAPIAEWIYSFHMPLFMMLSGMFFKYTLDKPFWLMIKIKCRTLLLPLLSWSIILIFFQLLVTTPLNEWSDVLKNWVLSGGPLRGYWYLKCLFLYLVVGYIAIVILNSEVAAAIATTALFLILPNVNFSRMMIVFFWLGYGYFAANKAITRKGWCFIVFMLIMIACYTNEWYIFTYLGANSVVSYCKFVIMGASASLFWILLFNIIFRQSYTNRAIRLFAWIGTVSLGIYCLHPLFYDPVIYLPILGNIHSHSTLIYLLWSIMTIVLCLPIIHLIMKSHILSFLLLGKRFTPEIDLSK